MMNRIPYEWEPCGKLRADEARYESAHEEGCEGDVHNGEDEGRVPMLGAYFLKRLDTRSRGMHMLEKEEVCLPFANKDMGS